MHAVNLHSPATNPVLPLQQPEYWQASLSRGDFQLKQCSLQLLECRCPSWLDHQHSLNSIKINWKRSRAAATLGRKVKRMEVLLLPSSAHFTLAVFNTHVLLNLISTAYKPVSQGNDCQQSMIRQKKRPMWGDMVSFLEFSVEAWDGERDQGSHLVFYLCCMGDPLKQDSIELNKEESGKKNKWIKLRDNSYFKGVLMICIIKEKDSSLTKELIKNPEPVLKEVIIIIVSLRKGPRSHNVFHKSIWEHNRTCFEKPQSFLI